MSRGRSAAISCAVVRDRCMRPNAGRWRRPCAGMYRAACSRNQASLIRPLRLVEHPVEGELRAAIASAVACDRRPSASDVVEPFQLVDLLVGDAFGGRRPASSRRSTACNQKMSSMSCAGERRHDVAAVRFELDHALAAQRSQRFAHRGDAHPELGRGLVEPDEGPRAAACRT